MTFVSVIIPCYNQGKYIDETVNSVLNSTFSNYEIIIINDGSSDDFTNELLANYNKSKCTVITTSNKGLAEARNVGIKRAKGDYILPLDADDRISPDYMKEAVELLDMDKNLGIVYCRVKNFGIKNGEWKLPTYSLQRMLMGNIIFCSAFFRKSDWQKVGGYKIDMKFGCQDWEFWLSLIETGVTVYQIPKIHFYYRIRLKSMARTSNVENTSIINSEIFKYHKELFLNNMPNPVQLLRENEEYSRLFNRVDHKMGRVLFMPLFYFRNLWYKILNLFQN
jgi:glycosyltransferase involved in cell wall biosynthesis